MEAAVPDHGESTATLRQERATQLSLSAAAGALCVSALLGWTVGDDLLTRAVAELPSMKVNTALSLLLLSVATASASLQRGLAAKGAAGLAVLIAALSLLQTWGRFNLGIDELLVQDLGTPLSEYPGRMAPMTGVGILLLGASVWITQSRAATASALARWLAYAAMGVAYLASAGFLAHGQWSGWMKLVLGSLSLPTAAAILLLGIAIVRISDLSRRSPGGSSRPDSAGSRFTRVALPFALLVPIAVAWLRERSLDQGWLAAPDANALAFSALGVLYAMLALGAASWVSELEAALRATLAGLERRVDERTQQLSAARGSAEQARERLSALVEQVDVGIVTVDARTHGVVLFNKAAERMFGRSAGSMVGQPLSAIIPLEAREGHDRWMRDFVEKGASTRRMGESALRVQGQRANGEPFFLEAMISRSDGGGEPMLTAVLRDLTGPLALEAEREARAAAEAANRAKTQQIGVIGHELKTPLNAVLGFSELTLSLPEGAVDERCRSYVTQVNRAGKHMLQLINDLTELSYVESGAVQFQIEATDIKAALDAVASMVDGAAGQAGVTLSVDPAAAGAVDADPRRLQQVLLNLVSNGIKYNRPGGSVRLACRAAPDDADMMEILVEDDGLGMTAQQQTKLFEPFNRLGRERGDIEGTGLGLALSRSLVHAMGGRVTVRSEPARGSVFTLHLRRAKATAPST